MTEIPLNTFEQSKLETLLRGMPYAYVSKDKNSDSVRRHYLFPKAPDAGFTINCYADYFKGAKVPSVKVCEASVNGPELKGDEFSIQLTDEKSVKSLMKAISYGDPVKKFFSHEQIYGKGVDGVSHNLFRYSFSCEKSSCTVTFSPKKTDT